MKHLGKRGAWALQSGQVANDDIRRQKTSAFRRHLQSSSSLNRGLTFETFEPRILLSSDLIPVAGSIDLPGETDFYEFTLANERSLLFDSLTNEYRLNWSLSRDNVQIVAPTRLSQSDANDGGDILSLDAGTYTLRVDGEGDFTGDYQFRLLNTKNAQLVDPGTRIDGVLELSGRETDLFQFEATEGAELFFDAQSLSGGAATWQLVDPDGSTVFGPSGFSTSSDINRFTVGKTGLYTLLLEGRV